MPPLTPKGGIFLHLTSHSLVENTAQWKITGAMILHCCRIVGGIKNKNLKKQPWGKVECFAFGGATVHFASRIKTARRITAKKPLMVKNFLEGG